MHNCKPTVFIVVYLFIYLFNLAYVLFLPVKTCACEFEFHKISIIANSTITGIINS